MEVGSQGKGPRDTCPAHLLHLFCPVPPLPNCLHQGLFSNELPAPQFLSGGLLLRTFPKQVLNLGVHVATPPGFPPTLLAEVVHEDDLLQEGPGRCVEDAVHGSQEGGPGLVVETEDDASCGQAVLPPPLLTPAGAKTRAPWGRKALASVQHPHARSPGLGWGCSNHRALLPAQQLALGLLNISP